MKFYDTDNKYKSFYKSIKPLRIYMCLIKLLDEGRPKGLLFWH